MSHRPGGRASWLGCARDRRSIRVGWDSPPRSGGHAATVPKICAAPLPAPSADREPDRRCFELPPVPHRRSGDRDCTMISSCSPHGLARLFSTIFAEPRPSWQLQLAPRDLASNPRAAQAVSRAEGPSRRRQPDTKGSIKPERNRPSYGATAMNLTSGSAEFAASAANSEIASLLGRFNSLHCRVGNLTPGLAESLCLLADGSLRDGPNSASFAANSHRGGK